MTTKTRNSVAIAVVAAMTLTAAANVHANELGNVRGRLLAARTQEDFAKLYESISRRSGGDANRIVEFHKNNGFSCQMGKTL